MTYADETFGPEGPKQQEFLHRIHSQLISHSYNREWLESTEFYSQNHKILNHTKTGGLWAWKPFVILETMNKIPENDMIIYSDRKDMFSPGIFDYVNQTMNENEFCLLLLGGTKNSQYTKRDTFVLMNCDEESYWNSQQLEAGFSIWKVCDESRRVLRIWLNHCLNYDTVSDEPSKLKEEFPEFVEHRYDQSILTNIAITEGLPVSQEGLRNYVECDYPYWYERNQKFGFNMGREIDSFLLSIQSA